MEINVRTINLIIHAEDEMQKIVSIRGDLEYFLIN